MKSRLFLYLWLTVSPLTLLAQTKHALIIAIGNQPKETGWSPTSALNDVPLIQTMLKRQGFIDISVLRDSEATKQGIEQALEQLIKQAKRRDIIFIHYSGEGRQITDDNGDEADGYDEAIACYGAPLRNPGGSKVAFIEEFYLRDDELLDYMNRLRLRLGSRGQLVFTADASHLADDEVLEKSTPKRHDSNSIQASRGGFAKEILQPSDTLYRCPFLFLAASTENQISSEVYIDNNKTPVGVLSYSLFTLLSNRPSSLSWDSLFFSIQRIIKEKTPYQTPVMSGFGQEKVFAGRSNAREIVRPQRNLYVLSIGISQYSGLDGRFGFANSGTDAVRFANYSQRNFYRFHEGEAYTIVLINQAARYDSILAHIQYIQAHAKPDDYFILNFAGYTAELRDSTSQPKIHFVPFDINASDSTAIRKSGISLARLKDWLEFIPANNQLILTEAGSTENFTREFVKSLIESSPTIAKLSKRNRVLITPTSIGLDNAQCQGRFVSQGPLNYYLTSIPDTQDFFALFDGPEAAAAIQLAVLTKEIQCGDKGFPAYQNRLYSQFFFERQYVDDLQFYLPADVLKTRGAKIELDEQQRIRRKIGRKVALLVGTNRYQARQQWDSLTNPVYDVQEIAQELREGFGFQTKLLVDAPRDSLLASLAHYARTLDSTDQLLIFVAGHGDYDELLFDDGFLVFADSKATKQDPFRQSYLSYAQLALLVNNLRPRQLCMVLDVCFGGTFDRRVAKNQHRDKLPGYENLQAETFMAEKLRYITRRYLTSGGKREVPEGYGGRHSPFSARLLEALRGRGGSNRLITMSDLFSFTKQLPSGPLNGSFGADEPGSEFILLSEPPVLPKSQF